MKPTYEQLERERNELAAQVERLLSEVVILTKESTYKAFVRFCESNRHYDLDPRLHTHGGGISVGGYISDYDTAKNVCRFQRRGCMGIQPTPTGGRQC